MKQKIINLLNVIYRFIRKIDIRIEEYKRDAVFVIINGKILWFDKHNAEDPELAFINPNGGHHLFDHNSALKVAANQGKRLPDLGEIIHF